MSALTRPGRRHPRGQSLVIVALSATALFGIIALGLDAGRLYFERRAVQNAADSGALAGAQDLLPSSGNPGQSSAMQQQANCDAAAFALKDLNDVPRDTSCTNPAYAPNAIPGYIVEPAANLPVTVTVWTPSRGITNEIHVQVGFRVPMTFATVIGFTNSTVRADAYAHGGFFNNQYAVFGFQAGPGGGNTVQFEQDGNAQIDNGNSGTDMCNPSPQARVVSNSKWHAPNPTQGYLNVNGVFQHLSAADTHAIRTYWVNPVNPVPIQEPAPNYEESVTPPTPIALWTNTAAFAGAFGTRPAHFMRAGTWTQDLVIPFPGDSLGTDYYIFDNGIYLFNNHNLTITGGIVTNTADGGPHTAVVGPGSFVGGVTNQAVATDGVSNGIEFVFDGSGAFSAASPLAKAPSVFFAAPTAGHALSGVTDSIAFFIKPTDTNRSPWTERIDGTKPTVAGFPFQVWGTVYVGEAYATATLQAASAWQNAGSPGTYAITGELISPRVDLWAGSLATGSWTPSNIGPPCSPSGYVQNPAGLLVQYNENYAPRFRGYAFLVR